MTRMLKTLVGIVITAVLTAACAAEQTAPASAPTSAVRAAASPTPTVNPSLAAPIAIPTIRGVFTPEDLREYLAGFRDENRIVVDSDVQVMIPGAWYETVAMWTGAAFIYHIPSMSVITLDYEGRVKSEDIKSETARERLGQVLEDAAVMREVRLRIIGRTYHPDWAVLQYRHGGGLVGATVHAADMVPDVTIWGDGRAVFVAEDGTIREALLDRRTVAEIIEKAMVLHDLQDRYAALTSSDAPTTSFTVNTTRGRKTVSVYGMNPAATVPGEQHAEVLEQLRQLYGTMWAAIPDNASGANPDEVVVIKTTVGASKATRKWASRLAGHVTGEEAREAVELAGLGPANSFLIDGVPNLVTVVPVLPILDLPSHEWPQDGLPRYPSVTAYNAPGMPYRYDQVYQEEVAGWYRKAMTERKWRLVDENGDDRQVWVRELYSNDPIVIFDFEPDRLFIEFLPVENGLPRHPRGVLGGCEGTRCELVKDTTQQDAKAWFEEYLGYLRWERTDLNSYQKEGWQVRLDYWAVGSDTAVSMARTPVQSPDWPAPTPRAGRQPVQITGDVVLESPINFNGAYLYSRGGQVTLLGDGTVNYCSFHDDEGRRDLEAVLADGALMAKVRDQLAKWGLVDKQVELPIALGMDDVPEAVSDTATFRIHLGSNSDCPVTYPISPAVFDFVVTRFDGTEVWRRSNSPIFSDGSTELRLGAREERVFEATWDRKDNIGRSVPEGAYWVQGYLNLGRYAGEAPAPRFAGKKLFFVGTPPPLSRWLDVQLESPRSLRSGDPVQFTLKVKNVSSEPVEMWHGDQPFDFVVLRPDGTEVWRWSQWRVFIAILQHTKLAPGETVQYDVEWDQHDQDCQPDPRFGGLPCQGNLVATGAYTVHAAFEGALSDVFAGYQETIDAAPEEFTIAQ